MKALKGYQVLFQKSKIFVVILLATNILIAKENVSLDTNILSKDRLDIFKLSVDKIKEDTSKLKKDWINPITYKYSKNYGESFDTEKSFISIDQPIFKSGGIYKAINYANALDNFSNLDLDIQRKNLIKDTTILLFNIKKLDLTIKKQEFLIKNGLIDIQRKKEQVFNGFADTSALDNSILDTNIRKNTLADLKFQKVELVNKFNNFANAEYRTFTLPKLSMINNDTFINKNLSIAKTKSDIDAKYQFSGITKAKYLPSVNATFDYTKYHETNNPSIIDNSAQNYGVYVKMPLDIRTLNDIESSRIDYLKAKITLNTNVLEENNFFKTKLARIKMINEKSSIAKDDFNLYTSLLEVIIEEKDAELKTQSDVDTLYNSKEIKSIEIDIYKLEIQIELLELYAKIG